MLHTPSAVPLAAFRAFLAVVREIPHLWEHHEIAPCTVWKRSWPKELADQGGQESTCTALPFSLLSAERDPGAQEKAPFPAQISPSPDQLEPDQLCSCSHSPRSLQSHHIQGTTPQASLPRSPGRAVIYKELRNNPDTWQY